MATFLDISLLSNIQLIFPFILIWTIVFAVLEKIKFFGENKGIHSIIAVVLAMMTLLSPQITQVLMLVSPWFVMLMFFVIFMILFYRMFGVSEKTIADVFTDREHRQVSYWILIITLVVFAGAMGQVFFTETIPVRENVTAVLSPTDSSVGAIGQQAFFNTIFHPKVLGFAFIMIVATFTIKTLSGELIFPK